MCKALSKSISHITISQIEPSPFRFQFMDGERNRIFALINSLPDSSKVIIRDSEFVGLNDGNIDLGRISFKNIERLRLQRCSFKDGTELDVEDVAALELVDFSIEMIDNIELQRGHVNIFRTWGAPVTLKNRIINTQEFRVNGGLDVQNVTFTGASASFWASAEFPLRIERFNAPNLYDLRIVFREELPPSISLNAPLLHRVEWSLTGIVFGTENVRQYQEEDFIFLRDIRELKLGYFFEPLHKIDLHRLTKLFLECNRMSTDVERVFPSLKELVVSLCYCYLECVPLIKAENLERLEIVSGDKFRISSIIPTIRRYPLLKLFSFKNGGCSFLSRRWVEMSVNWMKWTTPFCNLEEVRCDTFACICDHRYCGF